MLVKQKRGDDPAVLPARQKSQSILQRQLFHASNLSARLFRGGRRLPAGFSLPAEDVLSCDLAAAVTDFRPGLVHLHWIGNDFLSLAELARLRVPVLWTLHDCWTFTGGCHVPGDCRRFGEECGCCPLFGAVSERDPSRRLHRQKRRVFAAMDLTVVAPSRWMAEQARASSLLGARRVEVIPNGLDLTRYRPVPRETAREILGLPRAATILLFGGMSPTSDPNKGFGLLTEALAGLDTALWREGGALAIFGDGECCDRPPLPLPVHRLGFLHDDTTLALAYAAADVMVVPSRQEAFCQTASEALACGTPVVAFRSSGLLDVVDHGMNGYLAEPFDPADLRRGILWATETARRGELAGQARAKAQRAFDIRAVTAAYRSLYGELADAKGRA
jgi:glycosyltransferase involved in cell wall biosynthesis